MDYQFYTADVFTDKLFNGAQIAIIPKADGLSETQMQKLAKEFNLSETVFVISGDQNSQFKIKTFTPDREADFASHTTIAVAHVLSSIGQVILTDKHTAITLEQNDKRYQVSITQQDGAPVLIQMSFIATPSIDRFVPEKSEIAKCLSLEESAIVSKPFQPLIVSSNGCYLIVPINSFENVRKARFNYRAWSQSTAPATMAQEILLFANQTQTSNSDFHLRIMGPAIGPKQDPPVGASVPAFASFLCSFKHIQKGTYIYDIERGTALERQSILNVEMDNRGEENITIRVGGQAVLASRGTISVPAYLR